MLELGNEIYVGRDILGAIGLFLRDRCNNLGIKKLFIEKVFRKYNIDLMNDDIRFYKSEVECFVGTLKELAEENRIYFKISE